VRALILIIGVALAVAITSAITSACKSDPPTRRHHEQASEATWNEVPLRLYGKDHGLKAAWMTGLVWEKATGAKADCDLDWYLEQSDDNPKLKLFMKYAAASSNGFDKADCRAMQDILEDVRDLEVEHERKVEEMRVKDALG
jgi:hypothetical protein